MAMACPDKSPYEHDSSGILQCDGLVECSVTRRSVIAELLVQYLFFVCWLH